MALRSMQLISDSSSPIPLLLDILKKTLPPKYLRVERSFTVTNATLSSSGPAREHILPS